MMQLERWFRGYGHKMERWCLVALGPKVALAIFSISSKEIGFCWWRNWVIFLKVAVNEWGIYRRENVSPPHWNNLGEVDWQDSSCPKAQDWQVLTLDFYEGQRWEKKSLETTGGGASAQWEMSIHVWEAHLSIWRKNKWVHMSNAPSQLSKQQDGSSLVMYKVNSRYYLAWICVHGLRSGQDVYHWIKLQGLIRVWRTVISILTKKMRNFQMCTASSTRIATQKNIKKFSALGRFS